MTPRQLFDVVTYYGVTTAMLIALLSLSASILSRILQ